MRSHRFLLRKRFFFFPENEAMRAAAVKDILKDAKAQSYHNTA